MLIAMKARLEGSGTADTGVRMLRDGNVPAKTQVLIALAKSPIHTACQK